MAAAEIVLNVNQEVGRSSMDKIHARTAHIADGSFPQIMLRREDGVHEIVWQGALVTDPEVSALVVAENRIDDVLRSLFAEPSRSSTDATAPAPTPVADPLAGS